MKTDLFHRKRSRGPARLLRFRALMSPEARPGPVFRAMRRRGATKLLKFLSIDRKTT